MSLSAPTLLALALVVFYLKDAVLWLRPDEAVLRRKRRERWTVSVGWRHYTLRGLRPCLCAPWAPQCQVVRLRWRLPASPGPAWQGALPDALRPLGWMSTLVAAQALLVLPALLLLHAPWSKIFLAVGVLYATIVVALAWTVQQRKALRLLPRECALLAAELLLCPPYAANLVRRLSLRLSPGADLIATARRLLDADGQRALAAHCAALVALELEGVEDAPTAAPLREARRHFEQAIESGRL